MGRSVSTLPHAGFEMGQGSNQVLQRQRPAIAAGFGQRPPERLGHKQAHDNDAEVAGFVTEAANVRYLETELALEGGGIHCTAQQQPL